MIFPCSDCICKIICEKNCYRIEEISKKLSLEKIRSVLVGERICMNCGRLLMINKQSNILSFKCDFCNLKFNIGVESCSESFVVIEENEELYWIVKRNFNIGFKRVKNVTNSYIPVELNETVHKNVFL